MPEYCQIETIVQCNQQTFPLALDQLSQFFSRLGYEHSELVSWISQITWPSADEERSVDILHLPQMIALNRLKPLPCAGLEVLIERGTNPIASDDGWLKPSILFDAAAIRDTSTGIYKPEVGNTLWSLFPQLAGMFRDGGIYLTDEWQEGRVLWAIAGIRQEVNPWAFDLALIPKALTHRFGLTPKIFQQTALNNWVGFARGDRWTRLPWVSG